MAGGSQAKPSATQSFQSRRKRTGTAISEIDFSEIFLILLERINSARAWRSLKQTGTKY
jgi:hypothetical protein